MTQVGEQEQQNLFVGSLSFDTNDDTLRAHFEQIGPVESARVVVDRERNNRSKGYGFVQFQNSDDNQKAIDELNGKDLDGRPINVGLARPREERPRRNFDDNRSGNGSFRQRTW